MAKFIKYWKLIREQNPGIICSNKLRFKKRKTVKFIFVLNCNLKFCFISIVEFVLQNTIFSHFDNYSISRGQLLFSIRFQARKKLENFLLQKYPLLRNTSKMRTNVFFFAKLFL